MTASITAHPPQQEDPSEEGEQGPDRIRVTLRGHAAQEAAAGARLARLSNGDFVIDAALSAVALARWEAAGYRIVARDAAGREFTLSPALMGINPPPSLE